MLIHVIGQISYKKKGVLKCNFALNGWQNKYLVNDAIKEIRCKVTGGSGRLHKKEFNKYLQ